MRFPGWRITLCILLAMVALAGCASKKKKLQQETPFGPAGLTVSEIQSELMSFADTYADLVAQAADEIAFDLYASDPTIRATVISLKVQTVRGAYTIAAGPNPVIGVFDMAVMVTLTTQSLPVLREKVGVNLDEFPEEGAVVKKALDKAHDLIWTLVAKVIEEPQIGQLHELIDEWRAANPDQVYVGNIRFADFAAARRTGLDATRTGGGNILGLVGLDPLAGLDPTTREIQQTRMAAERMFFYASRMPGLLSWQVEELIWEFAEAPEARQLVADVNRYADVAERFATIADEFPAEIREEISIERQAAIKQIQEAFATERAALFAEIDKENTSLDQTLRELRATVEAGRELAAMTNTTVTSVDALTAKFVSDEPAPEPDVPAEPVTLADIQDTIEQTTVATAEFNELALRLDGLLDTSKSEESRAELAAALAIAEASGIRMLNRAFLLLGGLVVLIFGASIAKVLIHRSVTPAK